jgi:hypothetical protein
MIKISLTHIHSQSYNRIEIARLLSDFNKVYSLRKAKDKIDALMLQNKPIEYLISEELLDEFIVKLESYKIDFLISPLL